MGFDSPVNPVRGGLSPSHRGGWILIMEPALKPWSPVPSLSTLFWDFSEEGKSGRHILMVSTFLQPWWCPAMLYILRGYTIHGWGTLRNSFSRKAESIGPFVPGSRLGCLVLSLAATALWPSTWKDHSPCLHTAPTLSLLWGRSLLWSVCRPGRLWP